MTAALLAKIDLEETKARVLAMEAVYWALGIRDPEFVDRYKDTETKAAVKIIEAKAGWSVVSFRHVSAGNPELVDAERNAGVRLEGTRRFRFHVYRPGEQIPDSTDLKRSLVSIKEEAVAYVAGTVVLIRRDQGP
jgi:hypothetical protein